MAEPYLLPPVFSLICFLLGLEPRDDPPWPDCEHLIRSAALFFIVHQFPDMVCVNTLKNPGYEIGAGILHMPRVPPTRNIRFAVS